MGRKNILFVKLSLATNIDAAEWLIDDILPRTRRRFPDSTLRRIGRNMPERLLNVASDRVVCLPDVSDIRDEYNKAFALLAPMTIAGGTMFKVLEGMARRAGISTREGIEGVDCQEDKHILIGTSSQSFVMKLCDLITIEYLWRHLPKMRERWLKRHTIGIQSQRVRRSMERSTWQEVIP